MNNDDMLLFGDIVNKHHDDVVRKSMGKSLEPEEKKYTETKKVPSQKWRKALIAALLVASLSLGGAKVAQAIETAEVAERINYYQSVMNSSDNAEKNKHSIENFVGYNYRDGNDYIVSYEPWNNENFVNYVLDASKSQNPVTEVRCALIAAYRVINEPYREEQFKKLFDKIKDNEEFINRTGFDGSRENIWQMLGYKDIKDFQENARKDTKNLYLAEKEGKNGKRM